MADSITDQKSSPPPPLHMSSSISSPSQPGPPRVRIRLTQNNNQSNNSSPSGSVPILPVTHSSPSAPPRPNEQTPLHQNSSNGHAITLQDRLTESLSPAPASPLTVSPKRESQSVDEAGKPLHFSKDQTPTSTNSSPSKSARIRRPEPTFVSSRDFVPLPAETQLDPHSEAWNTNKRSEISRSKAKVDGLVGGMNANSEASSTDGGSLELPPNPSLNPLRKVQSIETALPPLPLNTTSIDDERVARIPTHHCTPRVAPPRLRPRIFDLPEAPTFYPTREEFADPLAYIQYVGDPHGGNGKAFGIVKIVPPEGWTPEFVLNQDRFRFRTRLQQLNSLSADARATSNYQEQLQKFHAQQGRPRVSIPVVDRRAVDLYKLKLIVNSLGGFDAVAKNRKWAEVTRQLGYDEKDAGQLSTQIKTAYRHIIKPFEEFLAINRNASDTKRRTASPEHRFTASASPSSSLGLHTASQTQVTSPGLELMDLDRSLEDTDGSKRRSTRKRFDPSKGPSSSTSSSTRGRRNTSPEGAAKKLVVVPGAEEQMCEICFRGDNGTAMLLCDDCNRGYHKFCLDPPLASIPKSQWYCPPCLVGTGNDYGFDDGETHSLSSFWQRAESFRAAWWDQHRDHIWKPSTEEAGEGSDNGLARPIAGTNLRVSEDDVEREFWRLIHSPDENVEVEYGADVHSTTHGSALPTPETCPLSDYSRDGWNLNNLPILAASLLRFIKSDISGMTVPWIYVGMIFSTFCWHIEDHHTYSINYHHFGHTKTWYGVPGADAEQLEDALRMEAPDLFEQSPDLLSHLTTIMSPDKLKKHGVQVYACDQRANEFVITYPKAFHSGFNHGFNLNEAVNFALPDWIDFGLKCVQMYQQRQRSPVFSHDELLVTLYQLNTSVDTAMWLQFSMAEMVEREIEQRNELRRLVPNIIETVDERDKPEPEYQCAHCHVFCYLGQVTSEKADGVACLEHGREVCGVDSPTKWMLRTRYSDETLRIMKTRTIDRASVPAIWKSRLHKLIVASARPNLRNLRGLLHDGEKIPYDMPEVRDLHDFVEKAQQWVDEATTFIARKHQKRTGTNKEAAAPSRRGKRGSKTMEEEEEDMEGTQDELGEQERVYQLLSEADLLPFEAPEINMLRGVVNDMEQFKERAKKIFQLIHDDQSPPKLVECEEVLSLGNSLNVKLEHLEDLQKYVTKQKWIKEVEDIQENFTNIEEVESLIKEGVDVGVESNDALLVLLQERRNAGLVWKGKAEDILGTSSNGKGYKTHIMFKPEEVEELLRAPYTVAIEPTLHIKIENVLKHAREWTRQCEALTKDEVKENVDEMDAYKKFAEASRLLKHIEDSRIVIKYGKELNMMKMTQEALEKRIWQRLFGGKGNWEVTTVLETDARIKAEYLDKMEECFAGGHLGDSTHSCICHSSKSEKGVAVKCVQCHISYHAKCLDLEKKVVKEKDWQCPFCKPSKLPTLLHRQSSKKTLQQIRDILSPALIEEEERDVCTTLHPWGQSPTHLHLTQTEELACRLDLLKGSPQDSMAFKVYLIKQLLHCPLRIATAASPLDPIFTLAEKLYAQRGLDAFGREIVKGSAPPPVSTYQVLEIPPFRSTSRPTAPAPAPAPGPAPGPAPAPGPSQRPPTISSSDQPVALDTMADVTMNTTADYSEGEEANAQVGSSGKGRSSMTSDERKRKRGKRAKFVFEEEVGIFVPVQGERIYCLCHRPETGTMISCERCSLWFHNTCVHITSETDLGDERWICPMCCVKTERKYPHAEVKVKSMGEVDPHLWLDVRATLRSTRGPVNKMQHWTAEPHKRIALHLESFYPATLPTAQETAKRQKNEGSPGPRHARGDSNSSGGDTIPHHPMALGSVSRNPNWSDVKARVTPAHRTPLAEERSRYMALEDQERHKAGMANLNSRGVPDAMVQKWYIGWNGRDLVYPYERSYRSGIFYELNLGPRIKLASDDPDGTKLITALLREDEMRREMTTEQRPSSPNRGSERSSDKELPRSEGSSTTGMPAPLPPSTVKYSATSTGLGPGSASATTTSTSTATSPALSSLPSVPPRSVVPSHPYPPWQDPYSRHLPRPLPSNMFAQPPASPYRSNASPSLPPPLPTFTSRGTTSGEIRSPSLLASHRLAPIPPRHEFNSPTVARHSPSTSAPPSSAAAAPHNNNRQSPHSSPYIGNRPLTHSPRTPKLAHSLSGPSSSSTTTPPPSHTIRLNSGTPEKSLEEMRAIARKMKPEATDEEIEMMAQHALR